MSVRVPTPGATPPPSAASRRRRYAIQTAALVFAVSASCVFAVLIASRMPLRLDATATREHMLSEGTQRLLARLDKPYEIAIAADLGQIDPRGLERTRDVLDTFARSSSHVRVTIIDTRTSRGLKDYDSLLARIADQSRPQLDHMMTTLSAAADEAERLGAVETALSSELQGVQEAIPAGTAGAETITTFLTQKAAVARNFAADLAGAVQSAREALRQRVGAMPVPPVDVAALTLRKPLAALANELSDLSKGVQAIADGPSVPAVARDRARPMPGALLKARDAAARAAASIDDLPPLHVLSLARTLERTNAAIVLGPPGSARGGVTAIDFDSLFPPRIPGDPAGVLPDLRFRAEELIATAIASLSVPVSPIVVFVHGEAVRFAPAFQPFARLVERLSLRGIDCVEWAAALDNDPPAAVDAVHAGKRPVVYVSISTNASSAEGAARMGRLAGAIDGLVKGSKAVLLSVNPSTLAANSLADPMVDFLSPLGLQADSGRPLMQEFKGPNGRIVLPDLLLTRSAGDHPIARAINGLSTVLLWPMPLHATPDPPPPPAPTTTPLIVVPADGSVWAESEWLAFRQIPSRLRADAINPPALDSPRDDGKGPWTVAAAVERPPAGQRAPQRLVVVGSNGWFLDAVTQQATAGVVDGRLVLDNPGNMELFQASVYWLAGQDDLIARSAAAQAVPLIRPMSEAESVAIRWVLIAGMPVVVLLVGGLWRLIRG